MTISFCCRNAFEVTSLLWMFDQNTTSSVQCYSDETIVMKYILCSIVQFLNRVVYFHCAEKVFVKFMKTYLKCHLLDYVKSTMFFFYNSLVSLIVIIRFFFVTHNTLVVILHLKIELVVCPTITMHLYT